jgi:hypothetical protein
MCYIDAIYAYLRARCDGALDPERPDKHPRKPDPSHRLKILAWADARSDAAPLSRTPCLCAGMTSTGGQLCERQERLHFERGDKLMLHCIDSASPPPVAPLLLAQRGVRTVAPVRGVLPLVTRRYKRDCRGHTPVTGLGDDHAVWERIHVTSNGWAPNQLRSRPYRENQL